MAIHEVDPISRIEGHLGVKLTTNASGIVTGADVHGNLWRGFENFLIGRDPNDAITFTQRICGVCPVPHATASMFAVESVLGYNDNFVTYGDGDADGKGVPAKAVHIRNLVYAAEFLMSAITHFYHLAAPSYVQGPNVPPWTPYFDDSYYHAALLSSGKGTGDLTGSGAGGTLPANATNGFAKDLWSAVIRQYVKALRMRRLTFEAGALFAGRMPMVSSFVAGGTTNDTLTADFTARCDKFESLIKDVGTFIIKEYVPVVLALGALYPAYDNTANGGSGYGAGVGNFLSWGAFPNPSTQTLAIKGAYKLGAAAAVPFNSGKADSGTATTFVQNALVEHIARSRYDAYPETGGYNTAADAAFPGNVSRTKPKRDDATKYSWLKAPRLVIGGNTYAMEVGPFARLVTNDLYPVDGTGVAAKLDLTALGMADYVDYVKTVGADTGLDPAMIEPDLAVACVVSGLAKLKFSGGVVGIGAGTDLDIRALPKATIVSAYTDASAVILDGDAAPLVTYIYGLKGGLSTMDRLRCRALESLFLVQLMIGGYSKATGWPTHGGWIGALRGAAGGTYVHKATPTTVKSGFGVSEAPRGGLAHFISIEGAKITKYQCVVPTTWNACPKDSAGNNGPMEQAMIGIPFSSAGASYKRVADGASVATEGGVEALRIAQSFDPCIACAVH